MGSVDAILASHVLEHLLSLKDIFASFARILKPGGELMVLVPNSGGYLARTHGVGWTPMINEKHTLALDGAFFERNLSKFGFKVRTMADPYDPPAIKAAFDANRPLSAEGEELMVIGVRTAA
jgi:SAM-dependent methyltransferase